VKSVVRLECVGGGRGLAGGTCPTLRMAKAGGVTVVSLGGLTSWEARCLEWRMRGGFL